NDLVCITAPGMVGQSDRQVMRFYYDDITLPQTGSGHFQASAQVVAPTTAHIIKYIYLPSATGGSDRIGFLYDYSNYGMMYQITQYRGMTVSTTALDVTGSVQSVGTMSASTTYDYPTNTLLGLSDAPFYSQRTDNWAGRVLAQPIYYFSVDQ